MAQFIQRFLQWIAKSWPVWILGLVALSIGLKNLPSSGWITGWDNLHSEFWPSMNIARSLSAVWQEYQGLGLLGGMGHASDLLRELILWGASLIIPMEWLRYGYHILMHFLGMFGVYILLRHTLSKRFAESVGKVSALLGALYYGLNLGSILYFYAPFEPYSTFWGMLPWEIYILIRYLQKPSKNNLIWLFVINLLSVAQGYVQTLFLVYGICFGIIVLVNTIRNRSIASIKSGLIAGIVVLTVNAFWVLPAGYHLVNAVDDHNNSAQVSFSTEMFYLMNKGRGTIQDFAQMKLFYYDFTDWKSDGNGFDYFAPNWVKHYQQEWVAPILYGFIGLAVLGLFVSLPYRGAYVGIFLIGLVAFLSKEQGFSQLNDLMRKNELFAQLFRNPYTKLIVPTVMTMSIFIGVGIAKLIELGNRYISRYVAAIFMSALIIAGLVGISKPVWSGELFYRSEKIEIPSEYYKLFDYMKSSADPDGRIALLPAHYLWGWSNHSWGYRGSGFLWYGIKQPILDRAFDVWSSSNETFYNEFSTMIYGGGDVESVIQKYDVRYVLLDKSISDIGLSSEVFRYQESEKLLDNLKYKRVFEEGSIIVWDTGSKGKQFVGAPNSYAWVEGDTSKVRRDVVWEGVGTYVTSPIRSDLLGFENDLQPTRSDLGSQGAIFYPFSQLMREEVPGVEYGEDSTTLITSHKFSNSQIGENNRADLIIPGWREGEDVELSYTVKIDTGKLMIEWEPVYLVNGQRGPKLANFEYLLGASSSAWVSIGESQVFVKDQTVKSVAKLMVGEPIQIKIYDGVGKIEEVVLGEKLVCGEGDKFSCYAIPLTKQSKDSLLQTISTYSFASPNMIEVCLDLEGEPYECANKVKTGNSPISVMQTVESGERYWLDYVLKSDEVKLEKPEVYWYPIIGTKTVEIDAWSEFLGEKTYELNSEKLEISVTSQPKEYDFAELGKAEVTNCDVLGRGRVEKKVTTKSQPSRSDLVGSENDLRPTSSNFQSQLTHYVADERGAVCDYVDMTDLSTDSSYLMRMMGENMEGRSLKYFLYNTGSKRNDIEYLLGKEKFDQTFSLLPWIFDGSYSLNIETRSFGQHAENILEPVEVRWFPLEQIAGARIIINPKFSNSQIGDKQNNIDSSLRIIEVRKTGTWLYRVKVEGSGLLKLSQGYDEGWIAPPIKHVKLDGWANGWIIGESQISNSQILNGESDNHSQIYEITIFYWPQLLEYLGFVMLSVTIWVIYKS